MVEAANSIIKHNIIRLRRKYLQLIPKEAPLRLLKPGDNEEGYMLAQSIFDIKNNHHAQLGFAVAEQTLSLGL